VMRRDKTLKVCANHYSTYLIRGVVFGPEVLMRV
jgi:hypothetical protein